MTGIQASTSSANRTQIGIFGRMNAGKSSLINALTDQPSAIVSDVPGTTTDVVRKPMEIHGIGACLFLDTAGFDDTGILADKRIQATEKALASCDLAIIVFFDSDTSLEGKWIAKLKERKVPVMGVLSHMDAYSSQTIQERVAALEKQYGLTVIPVDSTSRHGITDVLQQLVNLSSGKKEKCRLLDGLVQEGDTVVLVMPQDPQAPVGRLIQPEVMTIRECLDRNCITICVTPQQLPSALASLKNSPELIITDSQVFSSVHELCPKGTQLTSFSILMAGLKGDIRYLSQSAAAIESLTENSRVLIAECCTHAPMEEDIGRVKIPNMLRKKIGQGLRVDVKAGTDFPSDASDYDLIIQCGGCMFNRRYIMSRIDQAKAAGVPMSNYGIVIAYLSKILNHVTLPKEEQ